MNPKTHIYQFNYEMFIHFDRVVTEEISKRILGLMDQRRIELARTAHPLRSPFTFATTKTQPKINQILMENPELLHHPIRDFREDWAVTHNNRTLAIMSAMGVTSISHHSRVLFSNASSQNPSHPLYEITKVDDYTICVKTL